MRRSPHTSSPPFISLAAGLLFALAHAAGVHAQDAAAPGAIDLAPPAPPADLAVHDHIWDTGEKIDLTWALSDDDERVTFYRIYRSMTSMPEEAYRLNWDSDDLQVMLEDMDDAPEEILAAVEALIPQLDAAAGSDYADQYKYDDEAVSAAQALRRLAEAGIADRRAARRALDAIDRLLFAMPRTEIEAEDDELETAAEAGAEMAVTAPVLEEVFGARWKQERWEERIAEIPSEMRPRLRGMRLQAEYEAEAAARATAAARRGQTRFREADVATPTRLQRQLGRMTHTIEKLDRREAYLFKVTAVRVVERPGPDGGPIEIELESEPIGTVKPVDPSRQPLDGARFPLLLYVIAVCGSVLLYIQIARSGKELKVRKIAGLAAVDEAVGRATEMGRPVLFVPGIQDMNDIQTIAGITVLSRVSRTAAEYDAKVEVPTARSLVMTAARETVQASYLSAGRPDAYNEDLIYYVTDEQFGFVAYLQGMMVREKPAACFYMGTFFAESLILAETGHGIGAIQIAGTAMPAQLPFFVAACDYTLIGEEFFAASAYLSGEPDQLGSLKGQDIGKMIVGILVVLGVILATIASVSGSAYLEAAVEFVKDTLLR